MAFSVCSWNVERFQGGSGAQALAARDLINGFSPRPDIIAIYEVTNSHGAFQFARDFYRSHLAFITEGQNSQEILVLIDPTAFDHVTVVQKHKFRIGNPYLRPGALVTVTQQNVPTNILFVHSASWPFADGFGDRFEILEHVFSLNERVQEISVQTGEPARLVVTGDLNTMGLRYPRNLVSHQMVTGQQELDGVVHLAGRAHIDNFQGMMLATKEHADTFSNRSGSQMSNLDHVLISDGLQLDQLGPAGAQFEVRVRGWQQLQGQARRDFIDNVSDHCALYFTVA